MLYINRVKNHGSVLITDGNYENRLKKACELCEVDLAHAQTDVLIVDAPEEKSYLGVEEIKTALKFLNERPYKLPCKILVFARAELIKKDAQNILLKVVEEPPETAMIFLLSQTEGALLETVTSRCRKFKLKDAADKTASAHTTAWVKDYLGAEGKDVGSVISFCELFGKEERETVILVLEDLIGLKRKVLLAKGGMGVGEYLEKMVKALGVIKYTNCNVRLALESLLLASV